MKKKIIKSIVFVAIALFIIELLTANLNLGVYKYKPSPNSLSSTLYLMEDNRFQLNPSGIYENPTQGDYEIKGFRLILNQDNGKNIYFNIIFGKLYYVETENNGIHIDKNAKFKYVGKQK